MCSSYDELHDRFHSILSNKSGTRYERLAAVVYKSLEEASIVIHDMKLVGTSGVEHQIDVRIEQGGQQRHVLLECKDFDVSEDKVGLGIARDFFAVVEDVRPDEAYIITCTGFTSPARQYAQAKGIRLAVLRHFEEADWSGRTRTIVLNVTCLYASDERATLGLTSESGIEKFHNDIAEAGLDHESWWRSESVEFVTASGRMTAREYMQSLIQYDATTVPGPVEREVATPGVSIEVEDRGPIPVGGVSIGYTIRQVDESVEIVGTRTAALLLQHVGAGAQVIWEDNLQSFVIDEGTGEVSRSEGEENE